MPELRWTLLILGALFIAVLAWWELRRQRQAPRQNASPAAHSAPSAPAPPSTHPISPSLEGVADAVHVYREPTITFPELQPEPGIEVHKPVRRELSRDPPVVELDAGTFSELRVEGATAEGALAVSDSRTVERGVTAPEAIGAQDARSSAVGYVRDEEPHAEACPADATPAGTPIVEWPGEADRRIVALRLVSNPAARFLGRNLRMALAAEGFVLGKFDIFHKPGPDARAVLSAASLTKPGTFAPATIDGQRFGGLSLFAVLPGPLPPQQTFDELLSAARNLNDRLQGALQDERGEPLTPMRSASIRESLASENGSAPPATRQPDIGPPQ
jgi:cell division protein ZipA